ncbi:hypothetical protein Tco_0167644 [Tanacetum coccineum]
MDLVSEVWTDILNHLQPRSKDSRTMWSTCDGVWSWLKLSNLAKLVGYVILKVFPELLTPLTLPENVRESAPRFDDDFPSIPECVSGDNSHVTPNAPSITDLPDAGIEEHMIQAATEATRG